MADLNLKILLDLHETRNLEVFWVRDSKSENKKIDRLSKCLVSSTLHHHIKWIAKYDPNDCVMYSL